MVPSLPIAYAITEVGRAEKYRKTPDGTVDHYANAIRGLRLSEITSGIKMHNRAYVVGVKWKM